MTISPDFSAASTAVATVLAAYLLLGEPWAGRRMYGSLARRRDTEPRALVRYFGLVLTLWWALAALAVAVLLLSPGTDAADFGLAMPDRPGYVVTGILLAGAVAVASGRNFHDLAKREKNVPGLASIEAMLPRTAEERRLAIAVAVTDGIGAELVYRGLLIAFGVGVLGLDLYVAAAFSVLVYAVAGFYQGRQGVLAFALFGAMFTGLYLATGSLLLPVAVHVILSVRDLTLPAPEKLRAAPEAAV
ncbi:CPBP family intramembrane glutamic endopeptidase [Streptomyces sp. Je 1-369]|uniref:CPBP family intramembrane glutamic endopeptidase n=1 Tax=Streptomyces sp. Je 1-369 TaxID=2966192 RepID=UPI0022861D08|nr:CPBP family intramembrane glutamic endopeptidase [Streptomyces sp. Je 1-369]WAL94772.1 CPBP family intramembrane metalloprotease [Streptomyces sp. Je 1-369]